MCIRINDIRYRQGGSVGRGQYIICVSIASAFKKSWGGGGDGVKNPFRP